MLIYPNHVTFDSTSFSALYSKTYSGENGSNTTYALGIVNTAYIPTSKADVLITIDGVTQDTSTYFLSNNNSNVTFYSNPTGDLIFKIIRVPDYFKRSRRIAIFSSVLYTNLGGTLVNSNTYTINGDTVTYELPVGSSITSTDDLLIYIDGVSQDSSTFVWPSSNTLAEAGVTFNEPISANVSSLQIRAYNLSTQIERSANLAHKTPDRGFKEGKEFKNIIFESQGGYEKRRMVSRRPKRSWELQYTNINGIEKEALDNFYNNCNGEFLTFRFDLSHIQQNGEINVRFDGGLDFTEVASLGPDIIDQIYNVGLKLREVYD